MRYAVVGIGLAFALGVALGVRLVGMHAGWVFVSIAAGAFAASVSLRRWKGTFQVGMLLAIVALGALRGSQTTVFPEQLLTRALHLTEITGTVTSYPSIGTTYVSFDVKPDSLPSSIRVTWFRPGRRTGAVVYGDRLRLVGRVRLPEPFDGFDYPAYLARRGVFATMTVDGPQDAEWLGVAGSPILRLGDRLRQRILERLAEVLSPDELSLAQSLLFGDRTALPSEIEDAFSRTGLMHLLAVSGLHLGIVLAGAWVVLRRLGFRPVVAYPLVGVIVVLVLWIVGPRVSLVRASLLFAFLALGSVLADLGLILRRSIHSMNGLAAAAIVILAIHPGALFDAGFQLTIAATAGILVAFSPVFAWGAWVDRVAKCHRAPPRWSRAILGLVAVSVAAQAGAAPVIATHFGSLHPWSIPSNVLAIPLAAATLWSGLATVVASGTPALAAFGAVFSGLLRSLAWSVRMMARLPLAELRVPSWTGLWMGGLVGFAFLAAAYLRSSLGSTLNLMSMTSGSPSGSLGRESVPPRNR